MQICPNCRKENANGDGYCYSCGHILPDALQGESGTYKLAEFYDHLPPQRRWGTAYFDRHKELVLIFRDNETPLRVTIDDELVLGRYHQEAVLIQPDIDLNPYGAVEKGVSRAHLKFVRELDTLAVVDLNSSNSTFLNGQRLMPFESRVLRDNDELRLGLMVIRVAFV